MIFSAGFKRYFSNTSWLMAERVFRLGMALFLSILVARYLQAARFGLLSYALSFVALFAALGTLGLDDIVVRELVRDEAKENEILGSAFLLKLVGSLLMSAAAITAALAISGCSTASALIALLCLAAVFQSADVIMLYFLARVQAKFAVCAQFISVFISAAGTVALVFFEFPLIYFALVKAIEAALLCVGLTLVFAFKAGPLRNWRFNFSIARSLLKDSWPLILITVCTTVYFRIDQVMIKHLLNDTEVGYYSAAVRLCGAWYFMPVVILSSLFPAILHARERDQALYDRRMQRLYDLMTWMAIAIAIPTTLLAKPLILLIYGPEFIEAHRVLAIYIWGGIFVFQSMARGKWIIAENLQKSIFWVAAGGVILNVGLNYLLIPPRSVLMVQPRGIAGAALASVISLGAMAFVFPFFIKKVRKSWIGILHSFNLIRILRTLFSATNNARKGMN